ncbi:MAG: biotin/lipoyl-binding protein [Lachnospiraceae bacterium]|nr:biotin/lipoyl-binding protein [Lachnospiraceae bacterium]
MKRMRQRALLLVLGAVLCLTAAGCAKEEDHKVSVQSVSMLMGTDVGLASRFGGVVVSQSETAIPKDDTKTIEEIKVQVGDEVQEGDVLFTYDKENLSLTIQKAELEIEQKKNEIASYGDQIAELEKERKKASSSDRLSYTIQIQSLELDRKEAEYNLKVKETELENMKNTLDSNEVTSPITGRVQAINENGGTDNYGNALPFMTIVESGSFRVKGTINENNRMELMEGTPVVVRSRIDPKQCWSGVVEMINWEDPANSNQNQMIYDGGGNSEMTMSSSYPMFITLNETEGLILGQHVYIEPDYGQGQAQGVWLNDGYLVKEGDQTYVWAASSSSTLEKRAVTTGEHNDSEGKTEITDGLSETDYVAWPEKDLKEGMALVYYDEEVFEQATTSGMEEFDPENQTGMDGGETGEMNFEGEEGEFENFEGDEGSDENFDGEGMNDFSGGEGETGFEGGTVPELLPDAEG